MKKPKWNGVFKRLEWRFYDIFYFISGTFRCKDMTPPRGGHRHLQIGRMLEIDLISETPPQMFASKEWESVWPEGQEAILS
jgi:hypothetical protein